MDFMWWQGSCWYRLKTMRMFAYFTEYVSEVACCASITLACLLNISNSLCLSCCKTDYLFCYISINVILLLNTHGVLCCLLQRIIVFVLAHQMCGRGCSSCVTQHATPLLSSCLRHWRSAPAWLNCISDVVTHPRTTLPRSSCRHWRSSRSRA